MARFARDCRESMNELTRRLEQSLGPDTSDLCMRFGLHSGSVVAGVLRGVRSRYGALIRSCLPSVSLRAC